MEVRKTLSFDLPLKKGRDKRYKIAPGEVVFTCFTSDFWVDKADIWRPSAWEIIRERKDLYFYIFTKRIHRFGVGLPSDWGDGYENVIIGCTVENQEMANYRLPIFKELPIKHKCIIIAPILEKIDISPFLDNSVEEVAVSGESGNDARICDYGWVLEIRRQCVEKGVPFSFHQTGAKFKKDGRIYRIKRKFQISQARKAGIDVNIKRDKH